MGAKESSMFGQLSLSGSSVCSRLPESTREQFAQISGVLARARDKDEIESMEPEAYAKHLRQTQQKANAAGFGNLCCSSWKRVIRCISAPPWPAGVVVVQVRRCSSQLVRMEVTRETSTCYNII